MMDLGKNQRRKMNAVDVLILLCVLVVVLALVYMMFFSDFKLFSPESGYDEVKIRCTLRIEPVDNDFLVNDTIPISLNDLFYNLDDRYMLGKVVEIGPKRPYLVASTNSSSGGSLIYGSYPGKSIFAVTVEASVVVENGVYFINGNAVREGDVFNFSTPYFTGSCVCDVILEVTET